MDTDFSSVKPIWYIDIDTLVTILQVIKGLDENLKRKIIKIITLKNKKDEERYNIINYNLHLKHLKEFSEICLKNVIVLIQKKADINKNEIEFLGMIISKIILNIS